MPRRVIGTANEIVKGNVKVIGESNQNVVSGLSPPGLVILDGNLAQTKFRCKLLLRYVTGFAKRNQAFRKHHDKTSRKIVRGIDTNKC